jgi:hypothetical protein
MPTSTISYLWRDPAAARTFHTGVSLHSHTNQSQETLDFVADWGAQYKLVRPLHQAARAPLQGPARHRDQLEFAATGLRR